MPALLLVWIGEQFGGRETWSIHKKDPAMIATKVMVPASLDESKSSAALCRLHDTDLPTISLYQNTSNSSRTFPQLFIHYLHCIHSLWWLERKTGRFRMFPTFVRFVSTPRRSWKLPCGSNTQRWDKQRGQRYGLVGEPERGVSLQYR